LVQTCRIARSHTLLRLIPIILFLPFLFLVFLLSFLRKHVICILRLYALLTLLSLYIALFLGLLFVPSGFSLALILLGLPRSLLTEYLLRARSLDPRPLFLSSSQETRKHARYTIREKE
jgi:hypothetical protein